MPLLPCYADLLFATIKINVQLTDIRFNYHGREGRALDTTDNRFIRRQLDATFEAERKMVCLYAESCFLNIQIVLGNVANMDKLEQLADELIQAERQFQLSRAALHRLGVSSSEIAGLSEQERLELFELHFKDPQCLPPFLEGCSNARIYATCSTISPRRVQPGCRSSRVRLFRSTSAIQRSSCHLECWYKAIRHSRLRLG